jgi:hypothetical protein
MTRSQKVLGKVAPTDNKLHTLYAAPTDHTALISNITVTNLGGQGSGVLANFDISFNKSLPATSGHALFFASDNDNGKGIVSSTDGINWNRYDYPLIGSTTRNFIASDGKLMVSNSYSYEEGISNDKGANFSSTGITSPWYNGYNAVFREVFPSSSVNFNKYAVCFQNDDSSGAELWMSTDLIHWFQTSDGTIDSYTNQFAYGNGTFISLNPFNFTASISQDGFNNWDTAELPIEMPIIYDGYQNQFIFANNYFIYSNGIDSIAYSTDGYTWETSEIPNFSDGYWSMIEYQKVNDVDTYVIFEDGQMGSAIVSTDLINWNEVEIPIFGYYDNGFTSAKTENGPLFLALGDYTPPIVSTDGYTWSTFGFGFDGWWITTSAQIPDFIEPKTKLYSNLSLNNNDFIVLEPGIICGSGDSISVKSKSVTNLTFSVYGVELS